MQENRKFIDNMHNGLGIAKQILWLNFFDYVGSWLI